MNVSQIFLSDGDTQLSPFLKHATGTVKAAFPEASYTLYDKKSLRQFIVDNYGEEVVWAYDKLQPYAYKADLGRYCLLNKLGGWYMDVGVSIVNSVEVGPRIKAVVFRDIQRFSFTSWSCSIGILYSQIANPAFSTGIDLIVKNCQSQYYGITPLCPTGPTLLGRALAMNGADNGFIYGDYSELTPNHEHKNRGFVLPNGTIMGWGKPCDGGDLTGLGAKGVNNYNQLWHGKQIYAQ
jgi:mannosyltransferase OCH1-like enzyme